jgi:predicted nucleic acid-binding protein
MKFAIDTSSYSALQRSDPRVDKWFRPDHQLLVPIIVIGELRAGFAYGNKQETNNILLDKFLASSYTEILHTTERTAELFAEVYAELRRIGRPINSNDIWIAALALEHDVPLLTLDNDFSNIAKLELIPPDVE